MKKCKCNGYGFFWFTEIKDWKGKLCDRVICLECGNPFWFEKLYYWYYGYKSNNQIRTNKEVENFLKGEKMT